MSSKIYSTFLVFDRRLVRSHWYRPQPKQLESASLHGTCLRRSTENRALPTVGRMIGFAAAQREYS